MKIQLTKNQFLYLNPKLFFKSFTLCKFLKQLCTDSCGNRFNSSMVINLTFLINCSFAFNSGSVPIRSVPEKEIISKIIQLHVKAHLDIRLQTTILLLPHPNLLLL